MSNLPEAPAPTNDDNKERRAIAMVDRKTWRRDLIIVAALSIALTSVGWFVVGDDSAEIREASQKNCNDLTDVIEVLTSRIEKNIEETETTPFEAENFGLSRKEFDKLINKSIRQSEHDISKLDPTETCEEKFG